MKCFYHNKIKVKVKIKKLIYGAKNSPQIQNSNNNKKTNNNNNSNKNPKGLGPTSLASG